MLSARRKPHFLAFCIGSLFCITAAAKSDTDNLADLSLEELGNIQITSVSKHAERLSDAPASIFVITSEDIRRSGVTSLPEALRLAPNLEVAQVSASGYAISARGFNSSSANKLLVLIDGRSVYTPLFSGVFWDVQDVMLEDVDRIEVISGPGGTLWGANAVNGVINIITRSAERTQGGLAALDGGNRGGDAAFRYGGTLGGDGNYRVYGKYSDRDHTNTAAGVAKADAWHKSQVGFRADWNHPGDQLMVQGNAYSGDEGQPLPGSISISGVKLALGTISLAGANLTTHWQHDLDDGSNISLQAYYDRTERTVPPTFAETLDIVDLEFQYSLRPAAGHALSLGAEYRMSFDRLRNSKYIAFLPADLDQHWASLFVQDEIALRENLKLTLGARSEYNDYTGSEFLPNVRLAWKFDPDHLLWSALSRTVRAPSRLDRDTFVPGRAPFLLTGGPAVGSEIAKVLEIGYRGQPSAQTSISITAFRSLYDHLRSQEIAPSRRSIFYANGMEAATSGIEIWGSYQATEIWRLSAGLTTLNEQRTLKPGSNDVAELGLVGLDPAQIWRLRSSLDLTSQSEFDATLRHVAPLSNPDVPQYSALDFRYGWRPRPDLELSVSGQNIFASGHGEFTSIATRTELERGVFFKLVSRF